MNLNMLLEFLFRRVLYEYLRQCLIYGNTNMGEARKEREKGSHENLHPSATFILKLGRVI